MIIGDLDLDWAEQDPDYLVEVKAFLISTPLITTIDIPSPNGAPADSAARELALK